LKLPAFKLGLPQRLAALLLVLFLAQCAWVIAHQQLSTDDYRYARCGREMWERPSPLAGYFTSCGNLNGDGTFAYRVAGLPLTAQRLVLLATDKLRKPENRLYTSGTLNGSTWEARHEIIAVTYLMHLPFVFFALWLGAGLWWVARRLFGNEGGFFALGLYCFCPTVIRYSVTPNNDILAMWGLYGLVYTAIGVAHAMQGPRRKWKPRILLLTLALGLTAAAHLLPAFIGFIAAVIFMMYLAERRRSYVMQIMIFSALGALFVVFASYAFRASSFSYIFTGGSGRFWFSLEPAKAFFTDLTNFSITGALAIAALLWIVLPRSRYFGNTAPLLMALAILPIITTQIVAVPVLWAAPFLFTFAGGVFADVLETKQRKLFLALTALILITQAALSVAALPLIAHGL
jgi:hypothetical protein